jgi:outer membrane phospholipase A
VLRWREDIAKISCMRKGDEKAYERSWGRVSIAVSSRNKSLLVSDTKWWKISRCNRDSVDPAEIMKPPLSEFPFRV